MKRQRRRGRQETYQGLLQSIPSFTIFLTNIPWAPGRLRHSFGDARRKQGRYNPGPQGRPLEYADLDTGVLGHPLIWRVKEGFLKEVTSQLHSDS